jgi:hypothetical protein
MTTEEPEKTRIGLLSHAGEHQQGGRDKATNNQLSTHHFPPQSSSKSQ